MVCVDTDIMINFLRDEKGFAEKLEGLKEKGFSLNTTSVNGFELWKGAYRSGKRGAVVAVENCLNEFGVLPLDKKACKKSAELFEGLKSKGRMVDELDIMISSIAIVNGEKILTLNKKHFERIPGVELLEFFEKDF